MIADIASGQVHFGLMTGALALPHVKEGRLRALAIGAPKRWSELPELPTVAEAGFADAMFLPWYGIVAPAGTPADIINRLNGEITAILKGQEMNDRLTKEGADPVGNTPAEFARHIQTEIEKWRKVIRAAGIEPS
jgi:tripartite-type tricarboxylate transporter receptor subunit TctC